MVVTTAKSLILILLSVGIIIMAGCSSSSAASSQPAGQAPVQTTVQQSVQQPIQQSTTASIQPNSQPVAQPSTQSPNAANVPVQVTTTTKTPPVLSNRIDIVYFHTKLRCVTCLCFEKQVTSLISKYFQSDIDNGKLTYRVLNVQEPQNAAIAKKYGAVGSQLFINNVINDFNNIEDIQDIWSWNCVDNPNNFDVKVKSVIELYLKGKP